MAHKGSWPSGGRMGAGARDGGGRREAVRVKTAGKRKASSTRWLQRQLNDPYVAEARRRGYRSRAAFKLIELDDRFHILKPGLRVADLGCARGGGGRVVALDLVEVDPIPGATLLRRDFFEPGTEAALIDALGGGADVVLSDMAAPATGHAGTDHARIMALGEAAYDFAKHVLAPGGVFVAKIFQ